MLSNHLFVFNRHVSCSCLLFVLAVLLSSCVSGRAVINSNQQVEQVEENISDEVAANSTAIDADGVSDAFTDNDRIHQSTNKLLEVQIVVVNDARPINFMKTALTAASALFEKCQITLKATLRSVAFEPDTAIGGEIRDRLVAKYALQKPALFVIPSTAELDVAFSYLPSQRIRVAGTSWLTDRVSDRCFVWIMAHELGHVMFDHAKHSAGFNNIMSVACKRQNWGSRQIAPNWTDEQCIELRGSNTVRPIKVASQVLSLLGRL